MGVVRRIKNLIPWTVALGLFLESLDATILTTAIPSMAASLQVNPLDLKIALTGYLLSIAIFIPISSWAAQKYGTRNVYFWAMLVFMVGSLACGCAKNLPMLVVARILQGMGGALMTPVARMVLVRVFTKQELLKVISYMTIPALIGPMLGPLAGGVITSYLSWRWIFFVNVPFVLVGLYIIQRYFINLKTKKVKKLDVQGFVLFALASASFTFWLETLGEHYLSFVQILAIVSMGGMSLLVFYLYVRKGRQTLFDVSLFAIPSFKLGFIGNCCTRLGLGGMSFILPPFFQLGLNISALYSGVLMAFLALGLISMKFWVQKILHSLGFKRVLIANTFMVALSLLLFLCFNPLTASLALIICLFVHGLFASLQYSCMNALVLAEIPSKKANQASMTLSTMQQLGSSSGVGLAGYLLGFFVHGHMLSDLGAYYKTFCLLSILVCSAAIPFVRLNSNTGQKVSGHKITKPV